MQQLKLIIIRSRCKKKNVPTYWDIRGGMALIGAGFDTVVDAVEAPTGLIPSVKRDILL